MKPERNFRKRVNNDKKDIFMREKKGFYYGWIIVLATTMLSGAGAGITSYMMSAFIKPVSEALNINRAEFSVTMTCTNVAAMLFMPIMSVVFKKFPLKRVVFIGSSISAVSLFCFSLVTKIWMFYPLAVTCGICQCSISSIPLVILISNWFEEKRGLVTAITFSGGALLSMLLMPTLNRVIVDFGWRYGYRMLSIIFVCLTIPTILFLVKEKPEGINQLRNEKTNDSDIKATYERKGFTRSQAIRTSGFWIFSAAIFIIALTSRGAQQHLMPFWSDLGCSAGYTAWLSSIMMGVGILSKALLGIIYDKLGLKKASIFICTISFSAFLLLIIANSGTLILASAIVFGFASAIQILPATHMVNMLFGDRDYSSLYAITTMAFFSGVSIGTPLAALSFVRAGSYLATWYLYAGLTVIILALMLVAIKKAKQQRAAILGETNLPELN